MDHLESEEEETEEGEEEEVAEVALLYQYSFQNLSLIRAVC